MNMNDTNYGTNTQHNDISTQPDSQDDCKRSKKSFRKRLYDDELEGDVVIYHERAGKWIDWKCLWTYMGPGWLVSIAFQDPGNLLSDLLVGSYSGYMLLWALVLISVGGWQTQIYAARLGVITGESLSQVCRRLYPRKLTYFLWIMMELAIIANDIQQIIGTAIAQRVQFKIKLWVGAQQTAIDAFTFLQIQIFGIRRQEAFFAFLVGIMCICFFWTFAEATPKASDVQQGIFIPRIKSYAVQHLVGLVGAIIMPHNVYQHTGTIAARNKERNPTYFREAIKYYSIDAAIALVVSFLINGAIISVFAHSFFNEECAPNSTALIDGVCKEINQFTAHLAQRNTLNNVSAIVWAVGLIASGQAATMTGTFAGQIIMEGFLKLSIPKWQRVAITRTIALLPAQIVAILRNDQDGDASSGFDEWLNVIQALQIPLAVLPIIHFVADPNQMGSYAPKWYSLLSMWILSIVIIVANMYTVIQSVIESEVSFLTSNWGIAMISIICMLYMFVCILLIYTDLIRMYNTAYGYIFNTDGSDAYKYHIQPEETPVYNDKSIPQDILEMI